MTTRTQSQTMQRDGADRAARRPDTNAGAVRTDAQRPFDSTELRRVPRPRDDDPPYRSWWVIGANSFDDLH